jgi:hypothetical protein
MQSRFRDSAGQDYQQWQGQKEEIVVEESSGNVFADMGLPNPEERLAKAKLVERTGVVNHVPLKDLKHRCFRVGGMP